MLPLFSFSFITKVFTPSKPPRVALVFGAGVYCKPSSFQQQKAESGNEENYIDCSPTSVLEKRLDATISLWKEGKIDTIIVSGDNRSTQYNEPAGMFRYLKDAGVDTNIIIQDFAGLSTIDTCWRAKNVFQAQSVYVITQAFHISRASFLCRNVGLEVSSITAPNSDSLGTTLWGIFREIPASWAAVFTFYGYDNALAGNGQEPRVE